MLSRSPGLKVMFITGFAENAVMGSGQLLPNMALLIKPFPMEVLAEKIQDIMGEV
jgi:hypothetical protein